MMAYMKWVATIKDNVKELHNRGMLGVLAAITQIPEYRLRDWVTQHTIDNPSHVELNAIHEAMSEQIDLGAPRAISDEQRTNISQGVLFHPSFDGSAETSTSATFDSSD